MCRLCLATWTDTHIPKAELIHELMLRSAHDEGGQRDGWGVSSIEHTWRSVRWYYDDIPVWKKNISERGFILSHMRKASVGTGRTIIDNHPYIFDIAGEQLTAIHNGYFSGTDHVWQQGKPNTDSYQALQNLAAMLELQPDIDADLINEWLSEYRDDSHYAVMLHWRNAMYVLRGKTRTLAAMPVGNGYLVHTNIAILATAKNYLQSLHDVIASDPIAIEDNTMIRFTLGSPDVMTYALAPMHQKSYYVQTQWQSPKVPAASAENDVPRGDYVIAPAVTTPRLQTAAEDYTCVARRKDWSIIAGKLSPLRRTLAAMWAATILGYVNAGTPEYSVFHTETSQTELALLDEIFFQKKDEKFEKPFSPAAMVMLNWWNHRVNSGFDDILHMRLFGLAPFWLDSTYTQLPDKDGKLNNAQYIVSIWASYMEQRFKLLTARERTQCLTPITASTALILSGDAK